MRTLITDFAAAYPDVRFSLVADGKEVSKHQPSKSFLDRARELKLGGAQSLTVDHSFDTPKGQVSVLGVLSAPTSAVSSSGSLRLIVNGRSVRDRLLLKAVRDGYGNFLKPGKFPSGVLRLEIPASEVDVNVHPQKTEVRFRAPQAVFSAVAEAIQSSFASEAPLPPSQSSFVAPSTQAPAFEPRERTSTHETVEFSGSGWLDRELGSAPPPKPTAAQPTPAPVEQPNAIAGLSSLRFVAQVLHCYLILEGPEKIVVVDMHAAHERIRFYELKNSMDGWRGSLSRIAASRSC